MGSKPAGHHVPLLTSNDPCAGCEDCMPANYSKSFMQQLEKADLDASRNCICDYAQGIVCASHSLAPGDPTGLGKPPMDMVKQLQKAVQKVFGPMTTN